MRACQQPHPCTRSWEGIWCEGRSVGDTLIREGLAWAAAGLRADRGGAAGGRSGGGVMRPLRGPSQVPQEFRGTHKYASGWRRCAHALGEAHPLGVDAAISGRVLAAQDFAERDLRHHLPVRVGVHLMGFSGMKRPRLPYLRNCPGEVSVVGARPKPEIRRASTIAYWGNGPCQ